VPGALSLLVALAACSSDAVLEPEVAQPRELAASFQSSRVQQQVTGAAHIKLTGYDIDEMFTQSAIRHADGSVSGEFELRSEQEGGQRIHGTVTCFTVIGNTARIAGIIDRTTIPGLPTGLYWAWTVVDNGQGANDPPDQTSDFNLRVASGAARHCATGTTVGPLIPVLSGNLQVRG
jgi:hypothetical protein